jgi:hypothetical protein
MIRWINKQEFAAHLAGFAPIGIQLRSFLHVRTHVPPVAWFSNPPHVENGGGLGETLVWNGVAEEVPFVVAAKPRSYGWGMEVCLPHATAGDIALVPILRCIELPEFREPYFEQSQSCGRFAIVDSDSNRIYRGRKNDSEAVIDYLTSRHFVGYVLAELVEESEPWVIQKRMRS